MNGVKSKRRSPIDSILCLRVTFFSLCILGLNKGYYYDYDYDYYIYILSVLDNLLTINKLLSEHYCFCAKCMAFSHQENNATSIIIDGLRPLTTVYCSFLLTPLASATLPLGLHGLTVRVLFSFLER